MDINVRKTFLRLISHVVIILLLSSVSPASTRTCPHNDFSAAHSSIPQLFPSLSTSFSLHSSPHLVNYNHVRHRRSYEVRHRAKDASITATARTLGIIDGGGKSGNLATPGKPPLNVFATENSTVVMAQIGGTATLPCVVRKYNTGVVSWIRRLDYHLLTVGLTTYHADDRFLVEHTRHLQNWGLLIKHVQSSDAGLYECQVSTHPPTSIFIELKVTEASAEITGAPDLHLRAGSTLRLVCTLRQSTEPPAYVFWYHELRMINYDHGVDVHKTRSSSVLSLQDADKTHNGNYTCSPSNAIPASINVHVLNATAEEQPAAMQHANTSSSTSSSSASSSSTISPVSSDRFVLTGICLLVVTLQLLRLSEGDFPVT